MSGDDDVMGAQHRRRWTSWLWTAIALVFVLGAWGRAAQVNTSSYWIGAAIVTLIYAGAWAWGLMRDKRE